MRKDLIREFIRKVWDEGNVDAADAYIAPTYTIFHDPGDPWDGMTLDLEGFKDRVRKSRAPVPDQQFTVQEIFENDHSVALTWLWEGTHKGEIAGVPASGKTLHMSGATVYFFDGNRITGHWQVADRLGVYRQLQPFSRQDG